MRGFLRVAFINIIVLLCLLFVANVLSAVALYLVPKAKSALGIEPPPDPLSFLPTYEDQEYAAQIFYDSNLLELEYEPFVEWRSKRYQSRTLNVGPSGERVVPGSSPTASRTARFFGGSVMFGSGVDDGHTIPAQFAGMNPEYKVSNHAQTAFVGRQNLERLINLQDAPSDLVVFYDGVNDVAHLCRESQTVNGHWGVTRIEEALGETGLIADPDKFGWGEAFGRLFYYKIAQFLRTVVGGGGTGAPPPAEYICDDDPRRAQAVAQNIVRNWRLGHDQVEDLGGTFLGVLQPVAYFGDPRTDYLDLLPGNTEELKDEFREQYEAVYPLVQEIISEQEADWMVDLTDAFDGNEYVYIDWAHTGYRGPEIIAERISEIVEGLERSRQKS